MSFYKIITEDIINSSISWQFSQPSDILRKMYEIVRFCGKVEEYLHSLGWKTVSPIKRSLFIGDDDRNLPQSFGTTFSQREASPVVMPIASVLDLPDACPGRCSTQKPPAPFWTPGADWFEVLPFRSASGTTSPPAEPGWKGRWD